MGTRSKILPALRQTQEGRWREATDGSRLSTDAAFAGRWDPSVPSMEHLPVPGRI